MWKVIAADDEPFIREALKEMIPWGELGCHLAETLKNGKEVVNAVEKYKPDIVILDIQMPLTFVPHLKERFLPAADPPITQAFLPVIWHCEMILLTMLPMKLAKLPTDSRWKS